MQGLDNLFLDLVFSNYIMQKIRDNLQDSIQVMDRLMQEDILIFVRSGLDDKHVSPLIAAFNCLHAIIVSPSGTSFYPAT